ncbi:SRPBCC family protein [Flavobacterium marginilacus]|uniref:SRPBCC family protein n=1 Tax=Flavobacterium marginilacus TaxID=3003256 RepID=UPI00248EDC0F|nr:SRPBCC domain-containing protein [Flavobacterium marginilacus]
MINSSLQFDFLTDKEKNTITVRREFRGSKQLVWDCYTKSELLDQWFAPKPLSTKTKSMDFSKGGHWHYAMVEPNGTEYWGLTTYVEIKPIEYYKALDAFSNEEGEINSEFPQALWLVNFTSKGENAVVETVVTYNSLEDLETVIQMGMKEGLTSTLERLDDLLVTLK